MPTLYVENVPADLYEALRERARQHRKSVAAAGVKFDAPQCQKRSVGACGKIRTTRSAAIAAR